MKHVEAAALAPYALGCQRTELVDGALAFHRIIEPMRAIYSGQPGSVARMESTPCVRLRFRSDTGRLGIALRFGEPTHVNARNYLCQVRVDGDAGRVFGPDTPTEKMDWTGEIFSGPAGVARLFDIWLPHKARCDLLAIEIDDGAEVTPAEPLKTRWLAWGDSITQGMQATVPLSTHVARIAAERNFDVLNLGVGGAMLDARLADGVPDWPWDVASIAYGTNDFSMGVPPETVAGNAERLLRALSASRPGRPILLITTLPWVNRTKLNTLGLLLPPYRQALAGAAADFPQVRVIDGTTMVPEDASLFADGVHPNDAGFAAYAAALGPLLQAT